MWTSYHHDYDDKMNKMRNIQGLYRDGFRLKSGQFIYNKDGDIFRFDKLSEGDKDSFWAYECDQDGDIVGDIVEVYLQRLYLHPWFPNKEIKAVEIFQDLPSLKKGEIYKIRELTSNMNHFKGIRYSSNGEPMYYTLEFILYHPNFFKPLYEFTNETRVYYPSDRNRRGAIFHMADF